MRGSWQCWLWGSRAEASVELVLQRLSPVAAEADPLELAICLCQGRVPGCAPGGAVTILSRRRKKVTKERATPLSVSPSLRYGATCGARFRRGPRKLASLRFAQTARGPDPPEAVLLGTDRGEWSRTALRAIAALGPAQALEQAQRRHWGRIQSSAGIGVGSRFRAAKLVL